MMKVDILNKEFKTIENRKRLLLRKEVSAAYKRNNLFLNVNKKSLDEWLKNLLLDDTDETSHTETVTSLDEGESKVDTQHVFHIPGVLSYKSFTTPSMSTREPLATSEEDFEPFSINRSPFVIPKRFLKDFHLGIHTEPFFAKNLENQITKRAFKKAVSKYTFHMEMAQNKFRLYEPTFSQIA